MTYDYSRARVKPARLHLGPKTAVAIAYVASMFMSAMDNHIVNVMLPTLSRDFHAELPAVQWAVIGYVLSLAVFIPTSGWFGDRFGTKRVFLVALGIFTAASACCGQARNLPELVGFRVLQGAGGGLLTPVATTMLFRAYPPRERARMTRILIVPILLGPVLAQPVGGFLVQYESWRWAFYLNVPIGVVALCTSALFLVEHREAAQRPFDLPGFVTSALGLSLILYAFSKAALDGWTSVAVLVAGPAGVLAVALFVRIERHTSAPLLKVTLVEDRIFRATNAVNLLNTVAFSGLLFLAPVFLQEAKGETPFNAGLTTLFTALGVILASQTIGRIYPYIGPRRMATVGNLGLAIMLTSFLLINVQTSLWVVRLTLFVAGFFNSGTILAVQTSMFSGISSTDTSSGAALLNAGRQSSTAIGIAVYTTVISSIGGSRMTAFHGAFLAAAVFALAASSAAFTLIHDEDAAETMVKAPAEPEPAVLVRE
jgi:EmrB/QacA subfamily drug resistance transporter